MLGHGRHWKRAKQIENLLPAREIAAGDFFDDEGMRQDGAFIQQRDESRFRFSKVVGPNSRVDQDHRRRRPARKRGADPPSVARRSRAFPAISASRPA